MQKQKKQMIVLVILLILLILAYIGVHFYSKKQEEKENAKEEAEKIQVTDLEVSDITQFSYVLVEQHFPLQKMEQSGPMTGISRLILMRALWRHF